MMSNQADKTFKAVRKALTEAKKLTQNGKVPAAAFMDSNSGLASALAQLVEHRYVQLTRHKMGYYRRIAAARLGSAPSV